MRRTIHGVMEGHGYDRVLPPMIEFERSLASRMAGISSRRMFRFVDPQSLRMMALRSDITPQIGRIAGTGGQRAAPAAVLWRGRWSRSRRAGLDPAREKLQCGAELIGVDNAAAAAEVVAVAIEALQAAGARGVSVDFTLPDLVDTLAEKARAAGAGPDRRGAPRARYQGRGRPRRGGRGGLCPAALCHRRFRYAIEKLAAIDAGGVLAGRIDALRAIAARLGGRARLTLDPAERHGFEYQSWFGFVLYAEGVRGALGRGGTYRIAVPDGMEHGEVATGFSLYPDALIDLWRAANPRPTSCSAARPRCAGRRSPARDRLAHGGRAERGGRGRDARMQPCWVPMAQRRLSGALSAQNLALAA
jgi:ATP phosphoribosyltransferase regulatory subunit